MTEVLSSKEPSPLSPSVNLKNAHEFLSEEVDHDKVESSEDSGSESIAVKKRKHRAKRFSDSESDVDKENTINNKSWPDNDNNPSSDSDDYINIIKQKSSKSRIKHVKSDSESDVEQDKCRENELNGTMERLVSRTAEKRNKLRKKFQTLLDSQNKEDEIEAKHNMTNEQKSNSDNGSASSNDEEISSINEIRKRVKEHSNNLKMSLCDPDTSEDETSYPRHNQKSKKQQKRTKLTSPKHQRMSAKQAMESMQKIKSESNRMLREKEVSLPYHRPKALSLKDIMSRRKPAVSSDGKVLPIKMNDEQLRQYALQLEQRQKEMMELCKSDTEEEEEHVLQSDEKSKTSSQNDIEIKNKNDDPTLIPQNNMSCDPSHTKIDNDITSELKTTGSVTDTKVETEYSDQIRNSQVVGTDISEPNDTVISDINTDDTNVQDRSEDVSAEMKLVYNDSIEEENLSNENNVSPNKAAENTSQKENEEQNCMNTVEHPLIVANVKDPPEVEIVDNECSENVTEKDSQLISLQYDTENIDTEINKTENEVLSSEKPMNLDNDENAEFPDDSDCEMDDINMDDIDKIIENADIIRDGFRDRNSTAFAKDTISLTSKPKLTGSPGMVINLDENDGMIPKKLSGVELLKERFTYFAKMKTPEEMEREKEKRLKPGAQHLKLKQELEEKIAEQRSQEWAKRLESEKEQQKEIEAITGDTYDVEDDIDKIDAKLEETENIAKDSSSSDEEEEDIEDDVLIEDKPRKRNPLLEDEAEESNDDETQNGDDNVENNADDVEENDDENGQVNDNSDEDTSDDEESSESEVEEETKPKKGRILKAFEDSDDEECVKTNNEAGNVHKQKLELGKQHATENTENDKDNMEVSDDITEVTLPADIVKVSDKQITKLNKKDSITESQDDDLQLAQVPKSNSEDLFTSQESVLIKPGKDKGTQPISDNNDVDLGSQTFSIMTSSTVLKTGLEMELGSQEKISVISETQPYNDDLDAVVGMCSGSFSQNYIEFKPPSTQSQNIESQAIGDDILDMCTGKFYDNEFVSQPDDNVANNNIEVSQECTIDSDKIDKEKVETEKREGDILKSVLDELDEPEFESSKPMKYFFDGKNEKKDNGNSINNTEVKKKFVIDSDDETNENVIATVKNKKKLRKKKLEKRALQISDDEDDEYCEQESDEYMSENGDDHSNEERRLVEYDSEENEIEVKPQQPNKKKRKVADFFEQEAELTSEDEWVGSGDEDEAGLDRMEREEGDDETFHQGQLQAELGQIHMRDVLDQDKREVRLIQELLFEDGDLGGGGRQRKFRWRNADGEEMIGTLPDELADTQEEEFESEEQWRKQRHEREMFLKQLKGQDEEKDDLNVSVTRTTIIKANLLSRTMSSVLEEVNNKPAADTTQLPVLPEKKTTKDIPSPKKPFSVFQQNYHGSLLTRGRGALARLAALATPLAADEDGPKTGLIAATSKRNFVFAAITPENNEPKVTKRKAETMTGTPRLVKKMRTEDKKPSKSSLLDQF